MKYEFTGETKVVDGATVKRIKMLSGGLVGGWIEKESNLSHDGDCFVYDEAIVAGNATVFGNAQVYGNAHVSGNAEVSGYAFVGGNAIVCGDATVRGNATVYGKAQVCDNAQVYGNALVYGFDIVNGNMAISGTPPTNPTHPYTISEKVLQPSAITCTCDMFTVMNYGCKCGGFQREKEAENLLKNPHLEHHK